MRKTFLVISVFISFALCIICTLLNIDISIVAIIAPTWIAISIITSISICAKAFVFINGIEVYGGRRKELTEPWKR